MPLASNRNSGTSGPLGSFGLFGHTSSCINTAQVQVGHELTLLMLLQIIFPSERFDAVGTLEWL